MADMRKLSFVGAKARWGIEPSKATIRFGLNATRSKKPLSAVLVE